MRVGELEIQKKEKHFEYINFWVGCNLGVQSASRGDQMFHPHYVLLEIPRS